MWHASYPHYLEVGPYKFQVVHSFPYLGSDVNCNNDIGARNSKKCSTRKQLFLRTKKASKVPLDLKKKKTIKYWCIKYLLDLYLHMLPKHRLSQTNERRLSLFERKVLRCIFGAKQRELNIAKKIQLSIIRNI